MAIVRVEVIQTGAKEATKEVKALSAEYLKLNSKGATSNVDGLGSSLSKIGSQAAGAAKSLGSIPIPLNAVASAAGIVAAGVGAVTAALGGAVASVVMFASPIADMAAKTQASTEWLQQMAIAGGQVGVSLETVGQATTRLQANIGKTGEVSKEVVQALGAIGLTVSELKAMRPEEQFDAVAAAIKGIEDPATQASVAMALFGRGGAELLPLIRSEFQETTAEAEKLGIILDDKVVKAADHMGDRFDILGKALGATAMQFGGVIVQSEGFQSAVEFIIASVGELNQWIIANASEIKSWVTAGILVAASALQGTLTFVGAFVTGLGLLGETVLNVQKYFVDLSIVILKSPFAALIPGVALFRQELLGVAESMGKNLQAGTEFFQGVQKVGAGIDQVGVKLGDFKANILNSIAAGESYRKTVKAVAVDTDELGKSTAKAWPEVAMLGTAFRDLSATNPELAIPNEAAEKYAGLLPVVTERQGGLSDEILITESKTVSWGNAMDTVNDILSEARGLMDLFGVSSDSTFGKLIGWASKAFDMFNGLTGLIGKVAGLFGGGGGGGILGTLGGIAGGGGGIGGLLGIGGGLAGAAGGVGAAGAGAGAVGGIGGALGGIGSAISSGASAVMGGISSALAAVPVAGWIALAGIGVGLLVKKIFGGPSDFEKVGLELGMTLGEGVQHGIVNLFEERGGTIGQAIQLSLGEVIKDQVAQGKANFDELAEKIGDTFSFLEREEITATEAQGALNESVAAILPHLDQLGESGVHQMERILAAAQSTGMGFAGMDQFAMAYVQRAGELGIAVNNVILEALGLDAALAQVATSAGGVDASFAALPDTAAVAVEGISTAFAEGSAAITEGLTPVSDKMATEIREAGQSTSAAIGTSFATTNTAIQQGLSQVSMTFQQGVVPAAMAAANATMGIAAAAQQAATAAAGIRFPSAPDYSGVPRGGDFDGVSAAAGMNARLNRDTMIYAHAGEHAIIIPKGRKVNFESAQNGRGGGISMGGVHVTINGGASKKEVDNLLKVLQANERQAQAKLRKMLGIR